jgi:hypothetical protein
MEEVFRWAVHAARIRETNSLVGQSWGNEGFLSHRPLDISIHFPEVYNISGWIERITHLNVALHNENACIASHDILARSCPSCGLRCLDLMLITRHTR